MTDLPGPASHSFISQRLRLHYVDWGNPDAPPLILQHGGRDHCRNWDWAAGHLRHKWHVICPDLRGHGDSAWSPDADYTSHAFAYDFAQLVETLGYDQVTVVGHSLGGFITTHYAGWSTSRGWASRACWKSLLPHKAMPNGCAAGSKAAARPRAGCRAATPPSRTHMPG